MKSIGYRNCLFSKNLCGFHFCQTLNEVLTISKFNTCVASFIKMSSKKEDEGAGSNHNSGLRDDGVKKKETKESDQFTRYATRGRILTEEQKHVENAREKYFSLDLAQKRKLYSCKSKFVVLEDIIDWPAHFTESLASSSYIEKWWKIHKKEVAADIKPELNAKISVFQGDITTLEIDAIVNAANESLLGGGGVDGAIHRAAGRDLLLECQLLHGCKPGGAEITCGYKLPAKHVIHTVGPRGEKPDVLEECYNNCLKLVKENELKSVAFPCVSTGIFGYPNLNAAKVVLKTVRQWLDTEEYAKKVERIIFCLFLEKDVEVYNEQLQLFFPLERS